ncbi:MAG: ATP-binding protein [Bacteroidia bacterium]
MNPFAFGVTSNNRSFTNRSKELEILRNNFYNGINCTLVSPRRWGKSSLVLESANRIQKEQKGIRFCFIDMFSIENEDDFYQRLATQLLKLSTSKTQEILSQAGQYFKKLTPKLSLGLSPENNISISFDWQELQQHKSEVLDLAQKIAEKKEIRIVVCIDEFQSLSRFDDPLQFQRNLRAVWQHHTQVSYCLYGSKRSMMEQIFNNRKMPFYRFGDFIPLKKIAEEHWLPFIENGFKMHKKTIEQTQIKWIVAQMKCHPYYVQQLSYTVWNTTVDKVSDNSLEDSLQRIIEHNSWMYEREVENLSRTQLNLIKAILHGASQLNSKATMLKYNLGTSATVTKNKKILEANDVIMKERDNFFIVDPVFELWAKDRFNV